MEQKVVEEEGTHDEFIAYLFGSEQSVIQAQPITQSINQPLLSEITIINSDTSLNVRQNFITK